MENQTVVDLCGEYPDDFKKQDIASNPNFVFENDANYSAVELYDEEENTVFVNSFIECEHYVSGGWGYKPSVILESNLQTMLIGVILVSVFLKFIYSRSNFSFFRN